MDAAIKIPVVRDAAALLVQKLYRMHTNGALYLHHLNVCAEKRREEKRREEKRREEKSE